MVVVDTSVWIDFFRNLRNPETLWLDRALGSHRLALTDLIFCELLQGIRNDQEFDFAASQLRQLPVFSPGGEDFALAVAGNFRILRKKGLTIRGTVDCWIATFCLQENHVLLHRDRDFEVFEKGLGLLVVRP